MLQLESAAREVVKNWENGDLAQAIRQLDEVLRTIDADRSAHEETIECARKHTNDELEIDDLPIVSIGDDGAWVSAWVWVPIEEESDDQILSLQWLILPDETKARYTNWGDGRKGDASELVTRVNADLAINQGHSDWRLPSVDELKSLIGTSKAPKKGWFWSSSPYEGYSEYAWSFGSGNGSIDYGLRDGRYAVRLVRTSQ